MFNEKNEKWIKVFKVVSIIALVGWLFIAIGVGYSSWNNYWISDLLGIDSEIIDFLIPFVACGLIGLLDYTKKMLIIQYLGNVQSIRNKIIEEK